MQALINERTKGAKKKSVQEVLESIDWDFVDAHTQSGAHGIHPYPAKFIPQIPQYLISSFHPGNGLAVFDPFCGSGTTLVEAVQANLPAIGLDLHPLATLIAKVKATPLHRSLMPVAHGVMRAARNGGHAIPDIPNLDHWFKKDIQQALASLIAEIGVVECADERDALKVAFSSIVVRVSNQESDTRYAAIEKNLTAADVWPLFMKAVEVLDSAISKSFGGLFGSSPRVTLLNKNILATSAKDIADPVGLLITSPPYPNAYEYWLYHKYRMYWLGMDPIGVRKLEIGARPHYFRKNPKTPADFLRDMTACFGLFREVMVKGAYACVLIGRSIISGKVINNADILKESAAANGFRLCGQVERAIPNTRKAFNPSHGTINQETLLVFQRT